MTELGIGQHTLHKIFRSFSFRHISKQPAKIFPIYSNCKDYIVHVIVKIKSGQKF